MFFTADNLVKFLKFGVVGVSGTVVDFGITWLLKEKAKINKYVANGVAYMCGATSNYFFNRYWTFADNSPDVLMQYLTFLSVSTVGLGLNTLIIYILVNRFKQNFYLSKVAATLLVLLWNFGANTVLTFAKK